MGYLIAETTREEREKIVAESLGNIEANCDVCMSGLAEMYEDCDDRFAFIAGYTDGGAPFGVMWEEVGIDPGLPFKEKVRLYHMQMFG